MFSLSYVKLPIHSIIHFYIKQQLNCDRNLSEVKYFILLSVSLASNLLSLKMIKLLEKTLTLLM